MTSSAEMKRNAALAALEYLDGTVVFGVGSGSTVDVFIDALAASGLAVEGVVAASEASERRLRDAGIPLLDLLDVGRLPVYVDGTDEADLSLRLIKGRGGALAREKVLASASDLFVCIADESKLSRHLGSVPVPVEVLPMAVGYVAERLELLGGKAVLREGFVTDNANLILDVTGLPVEYPETLERTVATVAGVVECGVFALRPADVLLTGMSDGTVRRKRR
jgi:ribose 5-phosphate isomerase A